SATAAAALLLGCSSMADDGMPAELDRHLLPISLSKLEITSCALDLANGETVALDAKDARKRHPPWSSFKIVNLIIALETGTARGLDHRRRWDPKRRPDRPYWPAAWRRDHTLRTAFRQSVPWYFRDIALEVGADRYRSDLARFGYGNASVPDKSDAFWLGGPLEISAWEQMVFIKRLISGNFALSPRTLSAVRQVSMGKSDGDYALHGKTGSGPLQRDDFDGPFEGWFTGWVEREGVPSASFALYVLGPDYQSIRTTRLEIAEILLVGAGLLPAAWL
ncbi:MAG: penicillin-binding transpeptidase domain-containing protein, partial [Geminicoccaceae bacterium]